MYVVEIKINGNRSVTNPRFLFEAFTESQDFVWLCIKNGFNVLVKAE